MRKEIIVSALSLLFSLHSFAAVEAENAAVTPSSVKSVACLVNDYMMRLWPDPTVPTFARRERSSSLWTRAVYYEGLMALYEIDPQQRYLDYTDRWADFHHWTARRGTTATNADNQCCQQTYIDRHCQQRAGGAGHVAPLDSVRANLEYQMATGRADYWTWIDAIQMAMLIYSKMFRLTGDTRYILYARDCYRWTRDVCGGGLWNAKDGLWWRDKDFVPPYKEADGNDCYWSRGNGWVVAALVKTIDDIEAAAAAHRGCMTREVKAFSRLLEKDYRAMMKALLACQREDGFWNVSLHSPVTFGGPETSGTALFTMGMAWGVRTGRLASPQYRRAADKAWRVMAADAVHGDGFIGFLQGTGKEPKDGQPVTYTSIPDFEDYGAGCFLLCAVEYYKMLVGAVPLSAE